MALLFWIPVVLLAMVAVVGLVQYLDRESEL